MTRQQAFISAFTAAIREIGVAELKKTSMFARARERSDVEQDLAKAA